MNDWTVLAFSVGHLASDDSGIAKLVLVELLGQDKVEAMYERGWAVGGCGQVNQFHYDLVVIHEDGHEAGKLRVYSDGGVEILEKNGGTVLSDAAKAKGWL